MKAGLKVIACTSKSLKRIIRGGRSRPPGTGRSGTAAIIKANNSNRFFDIRLREYLARPRDF